MKPNEAIRIRGCSRVANYTGYGHSFHYNTPCETPSDVNEVIAIDAIPYGGSEQFSREAVLRDINKAIVGFQLSSSDRNCVREVGMWVLWRRSVLEGHAAVDRCFDGAQGGEGE